MPDLRCNHKEVRFCLGREYQRVGGGALGAPAGKNLVRVHAVPMPAAGPGLRAVCGRLVGEVDVTTDWQGLMAFTGPERCASCEAKAGTA
jgi:hypothetical protein